MILMSLIFIHFYYRHWGMWDGPQSDLYSKQKYDRGQNCWNGPDRSVKVSFVFLILLNTILF